MSALNKGMVIDARVGESITLHPTLENSRVVITIEAKHGQRARIRVQSVGPIHIDRPARDDETRKLAAVV